MMAHDFQAVRDKFKSWIKNSKEGKYFNVAIWTNQNIELDELYKLNFHKLIR